MPLKHGKSNAAKSYNIAELMRGKKRPQKVAVAIAMKEAGKSKKK